MNLGEPVIMRIAQQPKPPCDQIVPATFCNRSATDLLATTLQPPCDHPKFWSQKVADRLQAMCDRGLIQIVNRNIDMEQVRCPQTSEGPEEFIYRAKH